jgi:hypothetical protein
MTAYLCQYLNLGSMLSLGAAVQILSHVLKAWRPPFALFVISFLFAALGQAYNDTHANTFVAGTKGAHRWLGLIHASYSAGCLVGPFVATGVASSTPRWYLFYIFLIGISLMNQGFIGWAFWDTLTVNRKGSSRTEATTAEQGQSDENPTSRNKDASDLIKSTLRRPSVLLLSLFYFFYIGSAITMSGWVVEYLVDVRDGDLSKMGFVPAGFNVRQSMMEAKSLTGLIPPADYMLTRADIREEQCLGDYCWLSRLIVLEPDIWCFLTALWLLHFRSSSGCKLRNPIQIF